MSREVIQRIYDALPVTATPEEFIAGHGNWGLTESEYTIAMIAADALSRPQPSEGAALGALRKTRKGWPKGQPRKRRTRAEECATDAISEASLSKAEVGATDWGLCICLMVLAAGMLVVWALGKGVVR